MTWLKRTTASLLIAAVLAPMVGVASAASSSSSGMNARKASVHVVINPRRDSGHAWHGPGDMFVIRGKMATHLPEAPGAVLCIVRRDGEASCPGQRTNRVRAPARQEPPPAPSREGRTDAPGDGGGMKFPSLKGARYESPCPSAYDCEFEDIELPTDPIFGLVVIDPAMVLTNLVDAIIVTRRPLTNKDGEVIEFDQRLRDAVNKLARPGPFEAKRRLRAFQVRSLNECVKGCKFTQSEMTIEPQ